MQLLRSLFLFHAAHTIIRDVRLNRALFAAAAVGR